MSSHVADFNARNITLTAKVLQQGHRYHKLWKLFLSFEVNTTNWFLNMIPTKTLLLQGLSEPEFYSLTFILEYILVSLEKCR